MKSENYQIEAKADGNASSDQLLTMLQSLLEDRFQLKTHRQTKELPVYLLLPAKNGLRLPEPKEANCWPPDATPPPQTPGRGRRLLSFFKCGLIIRGGGVDSPSESLTGGSVAMPELARALSLFVGRPVIDKTGFDGTFDVAMTFLPNFDSLEPGETPPTGSVLPTIFIALQEKLGLRLESSKGPVEVLVIDSVERPSGN